MNFIDAVKTGKPIISSFIEEDYLIFKNNVPWWLNADCKATILDSFVIADDWQVKEE